MPRLGSVLVTAAAAAAACSWPPGAATTAATTTTTIAWSVGVHRRACQPSAAPGADEAAAALGEAEGQRCTHVLSIGVAPRRLPAPFTTTTPATPHDAWLPRQQHSCELLNLCRALASLGHDPQVVLRAGCTHAILHAWHAHCVSIPIAVVPDPTDHPSTCYYRTDDLLRGCVCLQVTVEMPGLPNERSWAGSAHQVQSAVANDTAGRDCGWWELQLPTDMTRGAAATLLRITVSEPHQGSAAHPVEAAVVHVRARPVPADTLLLRANGTPMLFLVFLLVRWSYVSELNAAPRNVPRHADGGIVRAQSVARGAVAPCLRIVGGVRHPSGRAVGGASDGGRVP